jgi:hypothetical protein
MEGARKSPTEPPSPSERDDAEGFVRQLDRLFIERLIEAGAFSDEEPEDRSELHEELEWVLRKIGFFDPGERKRRR